MDLTVFRKNFKDIIDLINELNSFGDMPRIKLPKIMVTGKKHGCLSGKIIRELTGFVLDGEQYGLNPVEYRFIYDPTCSDDEAFCTINDSLVELDISRDYEELIDRCNILRDWDPNEPCKPIVLKIRSNCVEDIEIVDIRSPCRDLEDRVSRYKSSSLNDEGGYVVVAADASLLRPCSNIVWTDATDSIMSLKRVLLDEMIDKTIISLRESIQKRLSELGDAIPVSDHGKMKVVSVLCCRFKEAINEELTDDVLTIAADDCRQFVEDNLINLQTMFHEIASEKFSRFPLIVSEIANMSMSVLQNFIRPRLEKIATNLHQTHLQLLHAFECGNGECCGQCSYIVLVFTATSQLIESVRSSLFASIDDNSSRWVGLLEESLAESNERETLRQKLKVMQKIFAHSNRRRKS